MDVSVAWIPVWQGMTAFPHDPGPLSFSSLTGMKIEKVAKLMWHQHSKHFCFVAIRNKTWGFPGSPVLRIPSFQLLKARVQTQVRELRPHKQWGTDEKREKKRNKTKSDEA